MRTAEAREYRDLLEYANNCDQFAERHAASPRAVQMLTAMAGQCRAVASVFKREPALHRHINDLPYCARQHTAKVAPGIPATQPARSGPKPKPSLNGAASSQPTPSLTPRPCALTPQKAPSRSPGI